MLSGRLLKMRLISSVVGVAAAGGIVLLADRFVRNQRTGEHLQVDSTLPKPHSPHLQSCESRQHATDVQTNHQRRTDGGNAIAPAIAPLWASFSMLRATRLLAATEEGPRAACGIVSHGLAPPVAEKLILEVYRDLDTRVGIDSFAELSDMEEDEIDATGGHSAYGELSHTETVNLLELARTVAGESDLPTKWGFFDLGSGLGKLVAHVWLLQPSGCGSVVGVELAAPRHDAAVEGLARLQTQLKSQAQPGGACREALACGGADHDTINTDSNTALDYDPMPAECRLLKEDLATTDLTGATVIYLASLCFSPEFMAMLVSAMAQSTVCSSPAVVGPLLDGVLLVRRPVLERWRVSRY